MLKCSNFCGNWAWTCVHSRKQPDGSERTLLKDSLEFLLSCFIFFFAPKTISYPLPSFYLTCGVSVLNHMSFIFFPAINLSDNFFFVNAWRPRLSPQILIWVTAGSSVRYVSAVAFPPCSTCSPGVRCTYFPPCCRPYLFDGCNKNNNKTKPHGWHRVGVSLGVIHAGSVQPDSCRTHHQLSVSPGLPALTWPRQNNSPKRLLLVTQDDCGFMLSWSLWGSGIPSREHREHPLPVTFHPLDCICGFPVSEQPESLLFITNYCVKYGKFTVIRHSGHWYSSMRTGLECILRLSGAWRSVTAGP